MSVSVSQILHFYQPNHSLKGSRILNLTWLSNFKFTTHLNVLKSLRWTKSCVIKVIYNTFMDIVFQQVLILYVDRKGGPWCFSWCDVVILSCLAAEKAYNAQLWFVLCSTWWHLRNETSNIIIYVLEFIIPNEFL